MDNKEIFAANLRRYMDRDRKSRKDIADALGISYYTVTDWVTGKKYPRMGKVEMLAKYFGILKSDLIENKTEDHRRMQEKNDIISDIVIRLRHDDLFLSAVKKLNGMDPEKLAGLLRFLE